MGYEMSGTSEEISSLVRQIEGLKRGGQFAPFIDFIQFPLYRNFQKDLRVSFEFPLTVVVGQNGSGKTSLLHALSGAPRNRSPGNWWFGTAMDPLDLEDAPSRNLPQAYKAAFWYGYRDEQGEQKRAVKQRIRRAGDPDYWEPGRPVEAYGMENRDDRHPVVQMQSNYMNFKTQINAFDRCFYFAEDNKHVLDSVEKSQRWQNQQRRIPQSRQRRARIQDYLRYRSQKLRRVLIDGQSISSAWGPMHRPRVTFTEDEIADISRIIGRQYSSGALVEHRFYESWGTSVLFRTGELEYSEAFAGSGESAVARLVHAISSSDNSCLFLLDEPETSLHPGAQQELLRYLLSAVRAKKLQVIISTHSPAFVRHLPAEAVRVLSFDDASAVRVYENVAADEAFFELGHPAENTIGIIVEDMLSKVLLESVAACVSDAFASRISVMFRPGGDSGMKQDASLSMLEQQQCIHYVFDGDKADECGPIDLDQIPINATSEDLDQLIEDQLKVHVKFRQDSNMTDDAKREIRLQYLEFLNGRFHCLPFNTTEEVLWDTETAESLIALIAPDSDATAINNEPDPKKRFDLLTRLLRPNNQATDAGDIRSFHEMFIKKFCAVEGTEFESVKELLYRVCGDD